MRELTPEERRLVALIVQKHGLDGIEMDVKDLQYPGPVTWTWVRLGLTDGTLLEVILSKGEVLGAYLFDAAGNALGAFD